MADETPQSKGNGESSLKLSQSDNEPSRAPDSTQDESPDNFTPTEDSSETRGVSATHEEGSNTSISSLNPATQSTKKKDPLLRAMLFADTAPVGASDNFVPVDDSPETDGSANNKSPMKGSSTAISSLGSDCKRSEVIPLDQAQSSNASYGAGVSKIPIENPASDAAKSLETVSASAEISLQAAVQEAERSLERFVPDTADINVIEAANSERGTSALKTLESSGDYDTKTILDTGPSGAVAISDSEAPVVQKRSAVPPKPSEGDSATESRIIGEDPTPHVRTCRKRMKPEIHVDQVTEAMRIVRQTRVPKRATSHYTGSPTPTSPKQRKFPETSEPSTSTQKATVDPLKTSSPEKASASSHREKSESTTASNDDIGGQKSNSKLKDGSQTESSNPSVEEASKTEGLSFLRSALEGRDIGPSYRFSGSPGIQSEQHIEGSIPAAATGSSIPISLPNLMELNPTSDLTGLVLERDVLRDECGFTSRRWREGIYSTPSDIFPGSLSPDSNIYRHDLLTDNAQIGKRMMSYYTQINSNSSPGASSQPVAGLLTDDGTGDSPETRAASATHGNPLEGSSTPISNDPANRSSGRVISPKSNKDCLLRALLSSTSAPVAASNLASIRNSPEIIDDPSTHPSPLESSISSLESNRKRTEIISLDQTQSSNAISGAEVLKISIQSPAPDAEKSLEETDSSLVEKSIETPVQEAGRSGKEYRVTNTAEISVSETALAADEVLTSAPKRLEDINDMESVSKGTISLDAVESSETTDNSDGEIQEVEVPAASEATKPEASDAHAFKKPFPPPPKSSKGRAGTPAIESRRSGLRSRSSSKASATDSGDDAKTESANRTTAELSSLQATPSAKRRSPRKQGIKSEIKDSQISNESANLRQGRATKRTASRDSISPPTLSKQKEPNASVMSDSAIPTQGLTLDPVKISSSVKGSTSTPSYRTRSRLREAAKSESVTGSDAECSADDGVKPSASNENLADPNSRSKSKGESQSASEMEAEKEKSPRSGSKTRRGTKN